MPQVCPKGSRWSRPAGTGSLRLQLHHGAYRVSDVPRTWQRPNGSLDGEAGSPVTAVALPTAARVQRHIFPGQDYTEQSAPLQMPGLCAVYQLAHIP
jgi:hypothetical protein